LYQEEAEYAKKVLARNAQLLTKHGVKQMAVGLITKKEDKTKRVGIVCYVTKLPEAQGLEPIPLEIEGVPVEVIVIPEGFKPRPFSGSG